MIKIPKTLTSPKQIFTLSDPNICWTFNGGLDIDISVSGTVPVFTDNFKISDYFKLNDFLETPINSIKFIFDPPLKYQNLYCALACINNDFPSDAYIIAPKTGNTPLLQFYSEHQINDSMETST